MTKEVDARRLWSRKAQKLVPYVPGEQPRERAFIKLNTNENPYPPSPAVLEILRSYPLERLRLYPDPSSLRLRRTVADYYGLTESGVFVGNGSDEVLAIAFRAFFNSRADLDELFAGGPDLTPADEIVFPDITYSFYPVYAQMFDIPYRTVALNPDFSLAPEPFFAPSAGIVLANPNAPTGLAAGLATIESLAASDRNRLLLVDEAYVDFGGESAVSLLGEYDNILVVQTCSKSRALAGLRVGYALGAPALIEALERVRDSFNSYTVDSLAQAAAVAAFSSPEWFEQTRAQIAATRRKTSRRLAELGFDVIPSSANFVFACHPAFSGAQLYEELRRRGILVRHFRLPRIENHLRITMGTDADMDEMIVALQDILADPA